MVLGYIRKVFILNFFGYNVLAADFLQKNQFLLCKNISFIYNDDTYRLFDEYNNLHCRIYTVIDNSLFNISGDNNIRKRVINICVRHRNLGDVPGMYVNREKCIPLVLPKYYEFLISPSSLNNLNKNLEDISIDIYILKRFKVHLYICTELYNLIFDRVRKDTNKSILKEKIKAWRIFKKINTNATKGKDNDHFYIGRYLIEQKCKVEFFKAVDDILSFDFINKNSFNISVGRNFNECEIICGDVTTSAIGLFFDDIHVCIKSNKKKSNCSIF